MKLPKSGVRLMTKPNETSTLSVYNFNEIKSRALLHTEKRLYLVFDCDRLETEANGEEKI